MNRLNSTSLHVQPASDTNGDREQLIARVRREIDAGTYDSPARMEAALERMIARLSDD